MQASFLAVYLLPIATAVHSALQLDSRGTPTVSAYVDDKNSRGGFWNLGHFQFGGNTDRSTNGRSVEHQQSEKLLESEMYLIASFPNLRQVAYLHLPDTVWRPLVVGDVQFPKACASDPQHSRIFVSDPPRNKIYWYHVDRDEHGLLKTNGIQHVAVEGYEVNWMSVNGVGDLYFTGKQAVQPPQSSYEAVFRIDLEQLTAGDSLSPNEVYSRPNSGSPEPKVWMPSGIAVDSFFIFWGNQERGDTHGSIVKGIRKNLARHVSSQPAELTTLTKQHREVRGMASAGTLLFYLTPEGVWGIPKTGSVANLISTPPTTEGTAWDPRSISFDGFSTVYFTDNKAGKIYSLPAQDTLPHDLVSFTDAPGVHGITVFEHRGVPNPWSKSLSAPQRRHTWLIMLVLALAVALM